MNPDKTKVRLMFAIGKSGACTGGNPDAAPAEALGGRMMPRRNACSSSREMIISIRHDSRIESVNGRLPAEIFAEYIASFKARNPHLRMLWEAVHGDGAALHMHLVFVPQDEANRRTHRASLTHALRLQGFKNGPDRHSAITQWFMCEREHFAKVMESFGVIED